MSKILYKSTESEESIPLNTDKAVEVILHEYSTLRQEAHARLGFYFSIYEVYILLLAGIIAYILQTATSDIILILPAIALPLYHRIMWDQHMVKLIDLYIKEVLSLRLAKLIGQVETVNVTLENEKPEWFGWFGFFPQRIVNRPKGYKHSVSILFLFVPFGVAISYSIWHLVAHFAVFESVSRISGNWTVPFFSVYAIGAVSLLIRNLYRMYTQDF